MLFLCKSYLRISCLEETTEKFTEINTFQVGKAFKGTVVNRALSSLRGGSLEITLTVPLNSVLVVINKNGTSIYKEQIS